MRAVLLLAVLASPAAAGPCVDHDTMARMLGGRYGESRVSIGLAHDGRVAEVWANVLTGTWTLTISTPEGLTCIATYGENHERVYEPPAMPMGEPA